MKAIPYNRKSFIVIATILMSVNNGLGGIFLPYFSKLQFQISSSELGFLAFISSMAYVATALVVARIERKLKLKYSLLLFLIIQIIGFVCVFLLKTKTQLLIPFIFVGISQGGFWPLVEGAMCDEQSPIQKKRAIAIFNFSWLFGLIIGPPVAGYLYDSNIMWPLWGGIFITGIIIILALLPKSLVIAPWKMLQAKELEQPKSLKYFVKLGVILNLISYLFIGSFRSVLVEFTDPLGLNSTEYGIIQAALNFGVLGFMYLLMKYDFWQYSKKLILLAILSMAILLELFAYSTGFYQLLLLTFLIGAPTALFYFSSLYYGMLGAKTGSDHGGHHEAMIGTGQSIGPLISGYLIALTGDPKAMFIWMTLVLLAAGMIISLKKVAMSPD